MEASLAKGVDLIARSKRMVVFTGAGVSTESGIPDFRSPNGIWSTFDREDITYQSFIGSAEGRKRYWQFSRRLYTTVRDARPNPAHQAITELDRLGVVERVITQNIDNLHQQAGLPTEKVIELHGNSTRARCLSCERLYDRRQIQEWLEAGVELPACAPPCGGILKPTTILFGEAMPQQALEEAGRSAKSSDCCLVVGSSLVVYPAAMIPVHAKRAGAALVIINLAATPQDASADVVIRQKAGPAMERILQEVKTRSPH